MGEGMINLLNYITLLPIRLILVDGSFEVLIMQEQLLQEPLFQQLQPFSLGNIIWLLILGIVVLQLQI